MPLNNTLFNDDSRLLKFNLSSEPEFSLNDAITITFTLENLTDHKIWVLKWYTPLEGFTGDYLSVTCDGKKLSYEGRLVKRVDPTIDDYILIGPHESVSSELNISEIYDLSSFQDCNLKFGGLLYDVIADDSAVPRKMDEHSHLKITGNKIEFKIK